MRLVFGERDTPYEAARVVVLPVPYDLSLSFLPGARRGPEAILLASRELEPFLLELGVAPEEVGIHALPPVPFVAGSAEASHRRIYEEALRHLRAGKFVVSLGGDHSIVHPLVLAHREALGEFSILHIDAHADLRPSYEGLRYSHATILYHISQLPQVERIVAVGVRDWAREEAEYARSRYPALAVYEMQRLAQAAYLGRSWMETVSEIVSLLPPYVYLSLDVDALEVGYVPNTGTPVPGGFHYEQLFFLLEAVRRSGRRIVAFDVCETGGAQLDALVSAHLIYRLCGLVLCAQEPL
jgi:agmatinase